MPLRPRTATGVLLCLVGLTALTLFLRGFWRAGLPLYWRAGVPQLDLGGAIYAWAFLVTVPLPITTGVAILWRIRSWRPFVGCGLLAAGVLALATMRWVFPLYQGGPEAILVGSAACGLPLILAGLFLLLPAGR
jgi:hypothetical protein